MNIGEANAVNLLGRALAGQPEDRDKVQAALDLLLKKAHKVLMAGAMPGQLTVQPVGGRVQVLHVRHPDDGCGVEVFIGDVRAQAEVEDIDPGRGHDRADWNDHIHSFDSDETTFGRNARELLVDMSDSEHITGEDEREMCPSCGEKLEYGAGQDCYASEVHEPNRPTIKGRVTVIAEHRQSGDGADPFGPFDSVDEAVEYILDSYRSGDFDPHGCYAELRKART